MKVFNTDERVKRIVSNPSAVEIVRNFLESRRNMNLSVMGSPEIETSQPVSGISPINPDLAPEMYNMVPLMYDIPVVTNTYPPSDMPVDLFSDEAKERRRLKQAYAESRFDRNAQSKKGARGLFQIMPITEKDYLGRGRGKSGDIWNEDYNGGIRDWVMKIIPRDLQEFWSEDDSDRAKLAKLYAAYNWGAGNLRSFLRKKRDAGVDISNPDNWVDDLNPETRRYVKYLAFDEDIPGSSYTNEAFEDAARKRGYMAEGGRLFENGGPQKQNWFTRMMLNSVMNDPYTGAVATASGWTRDKDGNVTQTEEAANSEGAKRLRSSLAAIAPVALGGMFGGAGIGGVADASTMTAVGRFATPLFGMGAFNAGLRRYTPWKNWADFALNVPMFEGGNSINTLLDYYPGADEKWGIKDWAHSAVELSNPAVFLPYGKMANAGVNLAGQASKYVEGVKDRLAESVVRMADNAMNHPQFIPLQVFSPRGISYILNPKAVKSAYKLPFKYSGKTLFDDKAHPGDLVDQWIGKSKVEGATYGYDPESLPKDFLQSMRRLYGKKSEKFPLVEFDAKPEMTIGSPRYAKRIYGDGRSSSSSGGIYDINGDARVDPGRYGRYLKIDENGNYYWDNWDLWKFHPDTQFSNGLSRFFRKPAQFVDSRGTPIIFHWKSPIDFVRASEEIPESYWTNIKLGSFEDAPINFGILDKFHERPGYEYDFEPTLASGGKIHIKPENRGKFTALLKRTGKSASWFKEHGTPLQRKRATFALNARKWKHDEGGEIEREPDNFTVRDNTYVNSLLPRSIGFSPAAERPLPPSLGQARWDDGVTGIIPFIGDGLQGLQAIRDFRQGDPVTGFQTAGMLLIPNIAEKAVRGLFRKSTALSALDDAASGPPPTLLEKMRKIREKADAQRALSGDIPDPARTVLSPEELGVEKNIPQEIKERLYSSSMERMRRQRPEMDKKELGHKFGDVTNRTYREYPRSTFDKAGVDSRIKGRHYDNGHIAMPDDAGDKAAKSIGHELRHELDYQVPLTKNENQVLFDAYGDDFDNTGHGGKSPKVLKKEEVTTNFDARNTLLGDKVSLSTDEQNALIDAATPQQIGMAVYKANAYGSSFMKKLVDEKKWTTDRVNKIKEAMKTVGAVSGAAAISRALYNDENLPVQLAEGGELYRGSEFMYNPQPEVSEETPVPYSSEGYKEQQFYDNPANRITYLVQPGDTSWGIANRSGVPLGTLLKMNPDIGAGEKIYPGQKLAIGYKEYVPDTPKQKVETSDDNMYYSVQKGDYLGKIAKDNGMSLESLLKLNPQFVGRENQINIGEKVNIGTPSVGKNRQFKTMKERREWESGLDNVGAIQNYKHDKNYAIIDKNSQTLTVYGPDNKIVRRFHVNTGSSNEDYNTKTYEDDKGHILYGQGNMSTPAGITEIVSVGNDYGHNSFVRARVGNDGKVRKVRDSEGNLVNDTIASSIHYEKGLYGPNASNGCVRMDGKDVDALKDYLGVGSRVYTLPQSRNDDGSAKSWFKLEDGKLSFYASDPVGETDNTGFEPQPVYEKGRIKKDKDGNIVYRDFAAEDDYNQSVDMTAGPLYSSYRVENNAPEYERNRAIFATTLADNKQEFMKELIANKIGVNSDTYNRLAELAMAIANQESEFGTGTTFIAKSSFPNAVRKMKGEEGAMSIGATQMKYAGYNKEVKKILENIGIDTSQSTRSQWDIANSAKATLALLAYFYNEQLTPSHRRKLRSQGMTEEEALAMMFNGKSVKWLEDFTSDPDWRSKTHIVPSLPGGLLKKHFNKESLVADYANKAVNYMTENESFYRKNGGLIEKYSASKLRAAIAKLKETRK